MNCWLGLVESRPGHYGLHQGLGRVKLSGDEQDRKHTSAWIAAGAVTLAAVIGAFATIAASNDDSDDQSAPPTGAPTVEHTDGPSQDPLSTPATPSTEPRKPADSFTPIYSDKRIKLVSDGSMVVVDLDRAKVDTIMESEWEDGTAAVLGYDFGLQWRGSIYSAVPWKLSSEALTPQEPSACLEAARAAVNNNDEWVSLIGLELNSSLCFETSEGRVARATILSYTEMDTTSLSIKVSVWAN